MLSSYLSPSRHSVYYFRWPIPPSQEGKRNTIRISLRTRCPDSAGDLARYLASCGRILGITVRWQDFGKARYATRCRLTSRRNWTFALIGWNRAACHREPVGLRATDRHSPDGETEQGAYGAIKVQTGTYLGEYDIVRYEDGYGSE
jgi:hypothetical protein